MNSKLNNSLVETAQKVLKATKYYQTEAAKGEATEDNFELDYILINESAPDAKSVLAYAHFQDQFICFNPTQGAESAAEICDWAYSFSLDLFRYLEDGYKIAYMTAGSHADAWYEISESGEDGTRFLQGRQLYLAYCKQNNVTAEILKKEFSYDGLDAMSFYKE